LIKDNSNLLQDRDNLIKEKLQIEQKILQYEIDLLEFTGVTNCVLGETQSLTFFDILNWYKIASQSLVKELNKYKLSQIKNSDQVQSTEKKDKYTLTIVTSLYKGGKYIHSFLENIVTQTVFCDCELVIVDANSPEDEYKVIDTYAELYPNIKYLRLKENISIYEAWNLAIKESNSEFITNANVDDAHRNDAFELKIQALLLNPEIDVVYSDVYYSYLENAPFDIVAKCGLRTDFPTANKFNLFSYNSPHNSPMWRRSLHDKIGYFHTQYKSAGDYEFWLRAAYSGSSFMKINDILVVYYNNPQGMSTKHETPSRMEERKINNIYINILKHLEQNQ
ncbi:MAG: glycosyltransferase, partial [Cyanobacteriota bacterium ELA615]